MIKLISYKKDEDLFFDKYIEYLAYLHTMEPTIEVVDKNLLIKYFENSKIEIFLIYDDELPVGFVILGYGNENCFCKSDIYIQDFYIFEEFQNKGYGCEAVKFLSEKYYDKDFSMLIVKDNHPALIFWDKAFRRLGYSERISAGRIIASSDNFYFRYYMKL